MRVLEKRWRFSWLLYVPWYRVKAALCQFDRHCRAHRDQSCELGWPTRAVCPDLRSTHNNPCWQRHAQRSLSSPTAKQAAFWANFRRQIPTNRRTTLRKTLWLRHDWPFQCSVRLIGGLPSGPCGRRLSSAVTVIVNGTAVHCLSCSWGREIFA